jgi:hypothetical protein
VVAVAPTVFVVRLRACENWNEEQEDLKRDMVSHNIYFSFNQFGRCRSRLVPAKTLIQGRAQFVKFLGAKIDQG